MRAFLIDPYVRNVELIDLDDDAQKQREQIDRYIVGAPGQRYVLPDLRLGLDFALIVRLPDGGFLNAAVDGGGYFREFSEGPQEWTLISGYRYPLAGRIVVLGADARGETRAPGVSLKTFWSLVCFVHEDQIKRATTSMRSSDGTFTEWENKPGDWPDKKDDQNV